MTGRLPSPALGPLPSAALAERARFALAARFSALVGLAIGLGSSSLLMVGPSAALLGTAGGSHDPVYIVPKSFVSG